MTVSQCRDDWMVNPRAITNWFPAVQQNFGRQTCTAGSSLIHLLETRHYQSLSNNLLLEIFMFPLKE